MNGFPKIYIATKLTYAARFRDLRKEWAASQLQINSRWLDMAHIETEEHDSLSPSDYKVFWMIDALDIQAANVVMVYGEPRDNLRGALVEAGMALAQNKLVLVVGSNDNFGTWQYHPLVSHCATLEHAKTLLTYYFMESRI